MTIMIRLYEYMTNENYQTMNQKLKLIFQNGTKGYTDWVKNVNSTVVEAKTS